MEKLMKRYFSKLPNESIYNHPGAKWLTQVRTSPLSRTLDQEPYAILRFLGFLFRHDSFFNSLGLFGLGKFDSYAFDD